MHLLLIEDNVDDQWLVRRLLRDASTPYKITIAATPEEAHIALSKPFDICMLDHDLGNVTGIELLQSIDSHNLPGPVILVTGDENPETDLKAQAAGAADYLSKSDLNRNLLDRTLRYSLQQHRSLKHMAKLAQYDLSTGLFSRQYFSEVLQGLFQNRGFLQQTHSLLYIDLDGFKVINDCYGHDLGDQAIIQIAATLKRHTDSNDMLAKHAGDAFMLLLKNKTSKQANNVAQAILEDLRSQPMTHASIVVTASIGIANYPEQIESAEELVRGADAAMQLAKLAGRNQYQCFDQETKLRERDRAILSQDLRIAIESNALHLVYQPQYSANGDIVLGVEALARWNHPDLGAISPCVFIELAEETGQILQISDWVINRAVADLHNWNQLGLLSESFRLAINISAIQFVTPGFTEEIRRQLHEHPQLIPHIELELTENVLVRDIDKAIEVIDEMHAIGVRIALDDFGIGHSSLRYLAKLPVDAIKIDRSFVADCQNNHRNAAIVASILHLGKQLDLDVVAEGVETQEQLQLLAGYGCEVFQGFYFSPGVPPDEIVALLQH